MRKLLKYIIHHTYRPILQWYLSKERNYTYDGIKINVKPDVFHPGFFYSSTFLLEFLMDTIELKGKKFLELGCGTALISIMAAKQGAKVTASDISPKAIKNARFNAFDNHVNIEFIQSNLFENMGDREFDIIAINPPYYKGQIKNEQDYAWYCGENMEFFQSLFEQLSTLFDDKTEVFMVLSDECDIDQIMKWAKRCAIKFVRRRKERKGVEWNCIFQLTIDA